MGFCFFFFFSSRRRHTRFSRDWSSDVCSSDLEADQPEQAIAVLEAAIGRDPVNEELYQRVMRIHGRLGRPDAVRRTMQVLEDRLADLGEAEPSEATRRVAARQLKPTLTRRG